MSDATPPPNDEIVSAHLDGEASADEAAMVRADPALEARAAELARVRAAVAAPIDAPAAAREAAIAAALDVFDQEVAPTIVAGAGPPGDGRPAAGVTDLTARRAEAGRRAARNGRILAAAAAVVVVLLGATAVVRVVTGRSESQLTAVTPAGGAAPGTASRNYEASDGGTQSERSGQGSGAEAPAAADAPRSAAPGGDPTTTVTGPPPTTAPSAPTASQDNAAYAAQAYGYRGADLGAVSNTDQLRAATLTALTEQAAQQQTDEAAGAPTPGASDAVTLAALTEELATCDAVLHAADREIGPAAFSAVAQYQGTNALVFVYPIDRRQFPAANGATRLYAVDRATCRVLDSQTP